MALTKNVGKIDKSIRLIAGALLVLWALFGASSASALSVVALVAGIVLIATGLINFCPVFKILGVSSFQLAKSTEQDA